MGLDNLPKQIPIIGGLFDDSDQQALEQLRKNQQLFGGLQLPQFQDYKPVQYDPTMAHGVTISEDPTLRSSQMSALNNLAGLATNGLSAVDQAGFENARNLGDQMARSGNAAAMQNAQARGVGGSGLEFAMREQANQDAAGRAQQAALQQNADSARQRALYNQAYGGMLGQVRGQDFSNNAANAGILNQFNMYNTGQRNQANMYNVGQANDAQRYNNNLRQESFNDAYQRASGQAGANTGMAQGYGAQNAANQSARNSNTGLAVAGLGAAFGSDTGESGKGNAADRFANYYG